MIIYSKKNLKLAQIIHIKLQIKIKNKTNHTNKVSLIHKHINQKKITRRKINNSKYNNKVMENMIKMLMRVMMKKKK